MGEAEILGDLEHRVDSSGPDGSPARAHLPATVQPHAAYPRRARGRGAGNGPHALAACAAGNYAIGFAADLIRRGRADVVMTGAAELIQELQFSGFVRLAAMAPERCQPFDLNRQGLLLGEGAGILVLESEEHAARRGVALRAEIGGHALSCDAYHITRPHPDAAGSITAMRDAIARSGISPEDVDFVNAHGTGTRHNDAAESKVILQGFPAAAAELYLQHEEHAGTLHGAASAPSRRSGASSPSRRVSILRQSGTRRPDPERDVQMSSPTWQGPASRTSSSTTCRPRRLPTRSPSSRDLACLRRPDRPCWRRRA